MDNEQEIESFRAKENDDKGGFNKLVDRETVSGTEAV
jgi:hypothetical protein